MNNSYFGNNNFPGTPLYSGGMPTPNQQSATLTDYPLEQSYIENILRLNKGKKVRVHMTFPDSNEFRDREFVGIIEQSGRDHIILSEPSTGKWQLLLMIYVDFISFDEAINYSPEFIPNN
ncbi:MAG: spore coat protein GerQ [Bacilli bacterium]|jgi:spore germination protein Q|nr:spore coat protein GerQ [Bacilli bacterium]